MFTNLHGNLGKIQSGFIWTGKQEMLTAKFKYFIRYYVGWGTLLKRREEKMEFSKLGIAFVDSDIPNHKKIEIEISEKEEELIEEAKEKLEMWLAEKRLKTEMGIVVPIDF